VGVKIESCLAQVKTCAKATGNNTAKALKEWFETFPKPQSIQSGNGSQFTAKILQEWVAQEGISWVFHTPYYLQANGIVERTNSLLKRFLKPHKSGWAEQVGDAVTSVNSCWGTYGCPKITAFCPQALKLCPPRMVLVTLTTHPIAPGNLSWLNSPLWEQYYWYWTLRGTNALGR